MREIASSHRQVKRLSNSRLAALQARAAAAYGSFMSLLPPAGHARKRKIPIANEGLLSTLTSLGAEVTRRMSSKHQSA
ncbi:hypothetical protein COU17_01895 [Candidatus Kaiserbacteria bacterium CG10_big_fil_rev_8_21_14_0_10_49_17]|uniref:Uncharacterized protein n=1 Tax=Candidatus Kaiserbacteria bacterium CG10_big_fil_rev_8_21_14_0_10_49_17 TaxID=1974609 RepID=A0A2M6WEH0_9BACT|nr:MAG: hypothetical protein COU17_01895 [Candidatus Kaiserbacteria bacterium CG10_big_fil_rev_8_21_14_0_10_49_17]